MVKGVYPWPEIALIEARREDIGMSFNDAALAEGVSPRNRRKIVTGQTKSRQSDKPARAWAKTIARMAEVVGLTAEDMQVVRPDAALLMRGGNAVRDRSDQLLHQLVVLRRQWGKAMFDLTLTRLEQQSRATRTATHDSHEEAREASS